MGGKLPTKNFVGLKHVLCDRGKERMREETFNKGKKHYKYIYAL